MSWVIQKFQKPGELEVMFFYGGVSVGPGSLYIYILNQAFLVISWEELPKSVQLVWEESLSQINWKLTHCSCFIMCLQIICHSSYQKLELNFFPLYRWTRLCDCSNKQNMTYVMLCDFWACVRQGKLACAWVSLRTLTLGTQTLCFE